jgi:hypothetical protein
MTTVGIMIAASRPAATDRWRGGYIIDKTFGACYMITILTGGLSPVEVKTRFVGKDMLE